MCILLKLRTRGAAIRQEKIHVLSFYYFSFNLGFIWQSLALGCDELEIIRQSGFLATLTWSRCDSESSLVIPGGP